MKWIVEAETREDLVDGKMVICEEIVRCKDCKYIEDCCATCIYCRTIKTPEITGHSVDYVCQNKGSVIYDINIKNCDEMFLVRTPKVRGKSNGKNLD